MAMKVEEGEVMGARVSREMPRPAAAHWQHCWSYSGQVLFFVYMRGIEKHVHSKERGQ